MFKVFATLFLLLSLMPTATRLCNRQTERLTASFKPRLMTLEAVDLPQEKLPTAWLETFEPGEGQWEWQDLPWLELEPLELA